VDASASVTHALCTRLRSVPGGVDAEAVVIAAADATPDGFARLVDRVPLALADQLARSYLAVMQETAQTRASVEALPPAKAAQLLRLLMHGSRRDARALARAWGCGGGSRDLDLAIGRALLAAPEALASHIES